MTPVAAVYPNHLLHLVVKEMTHSRAHLQLDCASYCSSARRRFGPSPSACYGSAASDFLCHRPQSAATANARFFFFSHLFASASVVRRVWGTYGSRLLRQPAGVCSQADREQLTQRHLLVVRWVAGPRDGQLEERAGVRPERCERGLGFPALVQGLASGRCAPRRPLTSPCPCEQSQERQGAAADSPAHFNAEDNQAAAPRLPQFRVSSVFAVDCLVEARPGWWSARGRGWPSRRTGLTIVASTAIWAPCHMGSPLATTSMRRPSPAGTSRLRSRRATCDATRAPASLQMRAAARSRGPALRASTPTCAQAERWSPYSSKRPPQGQRFGASGSGRRSLRRSMTRYCASGTRVSALVGRASSLHRQPVTAAALET